MAYNVFISYSTKDLTLVQHVQRALHSPPAVEVFVAEYSVPPGQPLPTPIVDAVKQCDVYVLVWSRESQVSPWVHEEIGMARGLGKPIIPLVLEDGLALPDLISELKYLPLYRAPQQYLAWLQQHVFQRAADQQAGAAVGLLILGGLLVAAFISGTGKGK